MEEPPTRKMSGFSNSNSISPLKEITHPEVDEDYGFSRGMHTLD